VDAHQNGALEAGSTSAACRRFCDVAQAGGEPGNVSLRPHFLSVKKENPMLSMIARWGHNVLLAGTALLTVAFFYLAR
jgi:hypothetical protein